ncbi:hypothetical protein [Anaeromusa acidaminophila]|uniref:hypothetical protein n=1 Tax=Anaeromusa acidaminophila TaxID=81464 RepID=UPI00037DEDF2|nr:hypothetical protein [Anaeromusa acidaminophila]
MEVDKWVDGYKVRIFPWIDRKNIYVNIQYYAPGSSLSKPPLLDKSALIEDNPAGRHFAYELTSTCVAYIASLTVQVDRIPHIKVA